VVTYWSTLRKFHRETQLLLLAHFLIALSYVGIYVVLFNLYLVRLGYETSFIGWINGVALLIHAVLCLPAGAAGVRWGVRRTLIAGALLAGIGLALTPLAEFLTSAWRAIWLVVAFSLAWSGASLYIVNFAPFLIGVAAPELRNHVFSVASAVTPIATFAGSLLGGLGPGGFAALLALPAESVAAYRYSLLAAALLFLIAVPVLFQTQELPQETTHAVADGPGNAAFSIIVLMALVVFLRMAGDSAGRTFFNLYLDVGLHMPTASIGMVVALGQLLAIPASLFTPVLIRRWSRERTILLSMLGIALSLIPLALVSHWLVAVWAFMLLTATSFIAQPAFNVYTQEAIAPHWRSTMSGAVTMATGVSQGLTAIGGGYLIASLGFASLYWLGASLTFVGAVLFGVYLAGAGRRLHRSAPA
jgi:MFS family permease